MHEVSPTVRICHLSAGLNLNCLWCVFSRRYIPSPQLQKNHSKRAWVSFFAVTKASQQELRDSMDRKWKKLPSRTRRHLEDSWLYQMMLWKQRSLLSSTDGMPFQTCDDFVLNPCEVKNTFYLSWPLSSTHFKRHSFYVPEQKMHPRDQQPVRC